jgi:nicotinamide-nucleotide amidase
MFDAELCDRAAKLIVLCRARGLRIASAESCTGGLVAGLITSIAGSSDVFERGFVTYSNAAKAENLGVDAALIDRFGAVSAEVAQAMAVGLLQRSPADVGVSITGIAGPGGGSAEKPVGLVHFGCARRGGSSFESRVISSRPNESSRSESALALVEKRFGDLGRTEVRLAAVATALDLLLQAAGAP